MPDEFGYVSPASPAAVLADNPVRGRATTRDEDLALRIATFQGTRRELATELGMSERTLYRRLKARGLA